MARMLTIATSLRIPSATGGGAGYIKRRTGSRGAAKCGGSRVAQRPNRSAATSRECRRIRTSKKRFDGCQKTSRLTCRAVPWHVGRETVPAAGAPDDPK